MDSKTQLIVDIIAKVTQGNISIHNAGKLLNRSRRTIERYVAKYQKLGVKFIVHGNKGRAPVNKVSGTLKRNVQSLIKEKYHDVNLQHLAELLAHHEGIQVKRETLRHWAHEIHHVKRAKRRRSQVRKKRERMGSAGLLLQMDGSTHRWFGEKKSCLIAMIDDATSELHAEFFASETTQGCMKVMRDVIEKKGLFKTLYVDKAGIFGGPKRCQFSQMQRACDELGITLLFAHSAQGKGRIERAFDTLQDRLVPEFRLNKITDMRRANQYLKDTFIPNYRCQYILVNERNAVAEFSKMPRHIDLDTILIRKAYRKIRNDHTFSFRNKLYLIDSPLTHSIAKQEIEIRLAPDDSFCADYIGRPLVTSEVVQPTKSSAYDLEIQKKMDAIDLAEKLGNVSEATRMSGCSRETIYKNKRLLKEKGPQALKRTFKVNRHHKNRTGKHLEKIVIEFSLDNPHLGQAQVSAQLKNHYNIELSPSGIRGIWLRENMNTSALRVSKSRTDCKLVN